MSNILAKDRKPLNESLEALVLLEELTELISKTIYNDKKIPKRRQTIGIKILDNCIEAYEYARSANMTGVKTKTERNHRKTYEFNAEKAINSVVSDIKLLPYIIPNIKDDMGWYIHLIAKSVDAAKCVSGWRKSDEKRIDDVDKKEK